MLVREQELVGGWTALGCCCGKAENLFFHSKEAGLAQQTSGAIAGPRPTGYRGAHGSWGMYLPGTVEVLGTECRLLFAGTEDCKV